MFEMEKLNPQVLGVVPALHQHPSQFEEYGRFVLCLPTIVLTGKQSHHGIYLEM